MKRPVIEERWNAATHGFGTVLSLLGMVWIAHRLTAGTTAVSLSGGIGCIVYAITLLAMFAMSTLSHSFDDEEKMMRFRSLDQACIYLLIVGTYTPFSIEFWNHSLANLLLATMWLIAICGFVVKAFLAHRVNQVSITGYLLLGWLPIVGLPLENSQPPESMLWILAGGIIYSLGTIFLVNDQRVWWFHMAWHLSVIAASAIHFAAVAKFIVLQT